MRTGLDQLFLTCFVLAGLARLARFNVTTGNVPKDANGKAKYFEYGTIMTGTLLEFHPMVLLFLAHGCCMLSKTLHVPKI
jgi:CDP-diacylglycerol--serine O-phosphatidyltransferase